MEMGVCLNNDWKFSFEYTPDMLTEEFDHSSMENVRIPHTVKITPYNCFSDSIYQTEALYRRNLFANEEWKGKHVLLKFDGAAHITKVYINGKLCKEHFCGYTEFKVDISEHLKFGSNNLIAVTVNTREDSNIPPFGNVIDYMTYGGIYRDVHLEIENDLYIEDAFVKAKDNIFDVELSLNKEADKGSTIKTYIREWNEHAGKQYFEVSTEDIGDTLKFNKQYAYDRARKWNIDSPVLYELKIELITADGQITDTKTVRFGFRKCEFKSDGFYLNGNKVKIRGLNRHQAYPYVGYAMPKRQQRRDADILKRELCVNAVRTSHYPQSHYFIDRCDEIGLLVFTEIPGWQHIGDEDWKKQAVQNTYDMVKGYRNHPSIIIWGVRINESQDDDEFYAETNRVAHELDDSRYTGGVRFLQKSNLLEDIYTYNDFLHNGENAGLDEKKNITPDMEKPYLVSEYNGHMFPTKMFDDEEHRREHSLRHARVINALYKDDEISGAFGWCMYDYNTHKDFGSGDRICYHGVMDMFRNNKDAAYVYASQGDRDDVLYVSSSMDIGEHPACNIGDVYVYTNADSVKVYKNDEFVKEFFPDKKKFAYMPHPPVIVDDFIGELMCKNEGMSEKTAEGIKEVLLAIAKYGQTALPVKYKVKMGTIMVKEHINFADGLNLYYKYVGNWGGNVITYRFEAIKNGKIVKTVNKRPGNTIKLNCDADTDELHEGSTYDVAAIRINALDENGNKIPYFMEPVILKTEGPIEVIGPSVISLKGGSFGTYVKTSGETGDAKLYISTESGIQEVLEFKVM